MTELVSNVKGNKKFGRTIFDCVSLISGVLKVPYIKSRLYYRQITDGIGLDVVITKSDYESLGDVFDNLTFDEATIVSQEEALYGEYPIDKHRLEMAHTWYEKQTPEVQNFVDLLIREDKE